MSSIRYDYTSILPNGPYYSRYCNVSSSESANTCWDGSTFRVNFGIITSIQARAIFLNIFLVINILIPLLGTLYIKKINQHRILNKKPIRLTHLVPWQSVPSALSFIWETGKLPAGSLAIIMLIIGALHIADTNVISAFITQGNRAGQCAFPQGLVFTSVDAAEIPYHSWPSTKTALNAQRISEEHIKLDLHQESRQSIGIYQFASSNPAFYAPEEDTIGWWTCRNDSNLQNTAQANLTVDANRDEIDLFNGLVGAGILQAVEANSTRYPLYEKISENPSNIPLSFFAWTPHVSGSEPWISGSPWNVSVAAATVPPESPDSVTIVPIFCSLNRTKSQSLGQIEDVLRQMDAPNSLAEFTDTVSSGVDVLRDLSEEWITLLEIHLNAMVMVSASGNSEANNPTDDGLKFFGCVIPDSEIGVAVFVLLAIQVSVLLVLCSMVLYRLIAVQLKWNKDEKIDVSDMPNDIVSLQLAFVRHIEQDKDGIIQSKSLKDYCLDWNSRTNPNQLVFKKYSANDMSNSTDHQSFHDKRFEDSESKTPQVHTESV